MIEGKDYKVYDAEDVKAATENVREAAGHVAIWLRNQTPGPIGMDDADEWMQDVETLIAAAGVTVKAMDAKGPDAFFVTYEEGTTQQRKEEIGEEAKIAMHAIRGMETIVGKNEDGEDEELRVF